MTRVAEALEWGSGDGGYGDALQVLGDLSDRVSTLLDRQRHCVPPTSPGWAVIPMINGQSCRWWLIADNAEEERRGREVVNAFFGPSLVGMSSAVTPDRSVPTAIQGVPNAHCLGQTGDVTTFVEALELMTSVRASAPTLYRQVPDPLAFLLRDFYLSLDQGDPRLSAHLLGRIESTGYVGSENLRFLRVERLARLGYWHELASLAWFDELSRARRPVRITEHLLETIWRVYFDEAAIAADPESARAKFEAARIAPRFGAAIRAVDVPTTGPGRRLALLFAREAGDNDRVERILARVSSTERALLHVLAGRARPAAPEDTRDALDRARDMFGDGDYDAVVCVAEAEPSVALVALAVRAAFELNDPRLARRTAVLLDEIDRPALPTSPGFQRILDAVQRLGDNLCGSWLEWLDRVASHERWPDAAEVARDLSPSWGQAGLDSAGAATAAADALLRAADGANAREVRACLDLLCSVGRALSSRPAAEPFVDALLLVLSTDENPSVLVRGAFFDLLMAVADSGPSANRYVDVTATAALLWRRVRSRDAVTWVLDVLDLLASRPAPDPAARSAFVLGVGQSLWDLAERMPIDERQLLEAIGADCGIVIALPPLTAHEATVADVWSRLNGKVVGLYSLLQGVGERLRARLEVLAQDVHVEHNSDTVATEALRSLAASADYLVVDTRHAAHAATGAIDTVRPREQQLFPNGGGLSSFIARLRDALEQEQ